MNTTLPRDIYHLQYPGLPIDEVKSVHPDPLTSIRYGCIYWIDHLSEIPSSLYDEVGLCDDGTINAFLKKHFLHWPEALSLMKTSSDCDKKACRKYSLTSKVLHLS